MNHPKLISPLKDKGTAFKSSPVLACLNLNGKSWAALETKWNSLLILSFWAGEEPLASVPRACAPLADSWRLWLLLLSFPMAQMESYLWVTKMAKSSEKSYHQNNLLEAGKLAQWIKCSLFKSSGPGFRLLEPTEELGEAVYVCNPSTRLSKQILEASWPPSLDKMVSPMFREKPCLKGYGREWLSKVSSVNLWPPHAPELVSKWAHMDMWWRIQYTKEDLPVSK